MQLDLYERTVVELNNCLLSTIDFLEREFKSSPDDLMRLFVSTEVIFTLIPLYVSNMYSTPGEMYCVDKEESKIRKSVISVSRILSALFRTDIDELNEEYVHHELNKVRRDIVSIIVSMRSILVIIQRDVIVVKLGVDLLHEINKTIKLPKNKFTITFRNVKDKKEVM